MLSFYVTNLDWQAPANSIVRSPAQRREMGQASLRL